MIKVIFLPPATPILPYPITEKNDNSERVTDQIDISPISLYAIQLAAFNDEKMLKQLPVSFKAKVGRVIYIMTDICVFWPWVFFSEDDAQKGQAAVKG